MPPPRAAKCPPADIAGVARPRAQPNRCAYSRPADFICACLFPVGSHYTPPVESEDTHPDKLQDFWDWLVENRTQVVLALVIALGVGMIWYVKKVGAAQDEEKAGEDLLAASSEGFEVEGSDPNKKRSERLQQVVADNPGTSAAVNAAFLAASELFEEREYGKAFAAFENFSIDHKESPLAAAALFGAAASFEAAQAKAAADALPKYERVVSQFPGSPEAMQAQVAMAKIHLAQTPPAKEKAKELLEKATKQQAGFIPGFWLREAHRLAESLNPKPTPDPEKKK